MPDRPTPRRRPLSAAASRRAVLAAATAAAFTSGIPRASAAPARPPVSRLRSLIRRMTLEEKVGQLFVMRIHGASATAPDPADVEANLKDIGVHDAAELVARYHVGGIIYFSWAHNTQNPRQIAELSNGIQRAGLAQRTPVPLLISTDQEQGAVTRIGSPATLFPGGMALGAGGSAHDARVAARITGAELRAMGVNQDYAPDADVNVNPANPIIGVRSFGADPQAAARLVAAQVAGYQAAGVAATAKHFPGHGDTATDSHTSLPVITHSVREWRRIDAPPFRAAIAAGIDSIMTAHILVPALDPAGDPATLSRPILTGVLRGELGYDGVVVTDALGMAGVRQKYGDDRVPVLALKAGADQLLDPPDLSVAWHAVLAAVRSGEIGEERIDQSLLRVLRLKARRGLFDRPYADTSHIGRVVGTAAHLAAADRITERTTTLLVNTGGTLPLRRGSSVLVAGVDPVSPTGTDGPPTAVLAAALAALGHRADALPTGPAPSRDAVDQAVAAARRHDVTVVTTYNLGPGSPQLELLQALVAAGSRVVQIAVRNPYDIAYVPRVAASLATYSWTDVAVRAAARVLSGTVKPFGRLPVAVPRADDPASVLYPIGYGLRY